MDEFPAKVSTETSSQPTQSNSGFRGFSVGPVKMDVLFIRTIPGILMIVEIVLGLLVWALIAGSTILKHAFGWVMFVSVTLWMLIFNVIATVLYITAFITNAASVPANSAPDYNNLAASAFFACLVMIAYCASSFFSFTVFRGQGSNAATNQATGSLPA